MLIGYVQEITRHPVKSFQGETVHQSYVMNYGLYGDRSHAFKDDSRVNKYLTITQCPQMAQYEARFHQRDSLGSYPDIQITTPDKRLLNWKDPELKKEMEQLSNRPLTPVAYTPQHVPIGALEEAHLLLITDASLDKLSQMRGSQVDGRRFRPNILINLIDKKPFDEEKWIGKYLLIGKKVKISLSSLCSRCMIITVDPKDGTKDPALLKTIAKEKNNEFGVYASVVHTGEISVGDEIYLLDE
ncbi:MOSC domain-containing protein [Jeotgalibacillus sp. S-D1]|uniref:MOSC domain-containing protein n=1 Tax=Jeotgalibacillus sp. S-D1 TaxID=2552189 RepID=UPI00105A9B6A|nr:MOSC domain-containing protein [Jeotgalibacillus sp. S-D1]TDL31383.1 MOSC domain-containing protein [Jeotgalibacillus sp. S-D1]